MATLTSCRYRLCRGLRCPTKSSLPTKTLTLTATRRRTMASRISPPTATDDDGSGGDSILNLSSVSGGFDALPPGEYEVTLVKVDVKKIQKEGPNQGKPMINLQWKVNGEIHPDYKNRRIFDGLPVTENTLFRVKQVLQALQADD